MARLTGVCAGHNWPAQPPNNKQVSHRLASTLLHMARLNAAKAIFG